MKGKETQKKMKGFEQYSNYYKERKAQGKKDQFVLVNENADTYIMCRGVFDDFDTAVGVLYGRLSDQISDWISNDEYELVDKKEFEYLEADSGWGWFVTFKGKGPYSGNTVKEIWYLLVLEEDY